MRLFIYGAQNIFVVMHKICLSKCKVVFADLREKKRALTAGSTAGGSETDG